MRIVIAASLNPSYFHVKAGYIVLASILEAFASQGHDIALVTVSCPNSVDEETLSHLQTAGVTFLGDVSDTLKHETSYSFLLIRWVLKLVRFLTPRLLCHDLPRFIRYRNVEELVMSWRPEAVLLFWDSWFEHLLPSRMPVSLFGYLARPRFASPLSVTQAKAKTSSNKLNQLSEWLNIALLKQSASRHYRRLRSLRSCANICSVDASIYRNNGIKCEYVPNTWPDAFGPTWQQQRITAEKYNQKLSILANIGDINGTGNLAGLTYFATMVLPQLAALSTISRHFDFSICGKGSLPSNLENIFMNYPVKVKGFVDDIDKEMLANSVLLLLNNAGPYTGGYTRVVYAFSSGSCLVAHSALADSMPEVCHGKNALLGSNPSEIAGHLLLLAENPGLVQDLGQAARHTYETCFAPESVTSRLVDMMRGETR